MNEIDSSVRIGKNVTIGKNVKIYPYVFIDDNVIIGDNCIIYPFATIGTKGEHLATKNEKLNFYTIIGNNCTIREGAMIHSGVRGNTIIGDNCYFMATSYVAHDTIIKNNVVVCNGAKIGGHCVIGNNCNLGLNSTLHQFSELDDFCMLGASAFFKGKSPSGLIWAGVPSKPLKVNEVGIMRANIEKEKKEKIVEEAKKCLK